MTSATPASDVAQPSVWDALALALAPLDHHAHPLAEHEAHEPAPRAAPSAWDALKRALTPIEERPRVVPNVEASRQTTRAGAPYVVIRNPAANTYLKLDPREYDLLPLMDGTRSVKALVVEFYQRHGVLAVPRITTLVQLLRTHRFLSEPPLDTYARLQQQLRPRDASALLARIARGFLFTEFAIKNVDGRLERLYRAVGWLFFTRVAIVVGLSLALIGPVVYLMELGRNRYPLFQIGGSYVAAFLLFTGLQLLTLSIHELGHAMAVKRAGRYVPRGGLLIYYGLPAGYVDTTDIWMAARAQRLITSFAGPYTGLVLGGLCALSSFLLPASAIGAFLFGWGFVLLLNSLFNFNPLLELDGYYLLLDWLEKPLLRARALSFVRGPLWAKVRQRHRLTREEIFFTLFGLASLAYSLFALYLAARFWQLRLSYFLSEALASGDLVAQAVVLLLTAIITIPLALALWGLGKRLLGSAWLRMGWLTQRAAIRYHREALEALRAVPLWSDLSEARLLQVARAMRAENVARGTEVVRQGELGNRFYVIARGAFEVLVDGQPIKQLGRGNYFGEMALLNNAPRNATVVALESSRIYSLDQAVFHTLLADDLQRRAQLEAAMAYRAEVAAIPLFRDLAPADLDLLLTRMVPFGVRPGHEFIRQGEMGDRFYVILKGAAEVIQDGKVVAQRGAGDALGEIALLFNVPRTATLRATEPTELLALDASDFHDLLASYLGRAQELQRLSHMRLHTHKRLDEVLGR